MEEYKTPVIAKTNQSKMIQELEEEVDRLSLELRKKHQEKRMAEEKILNAEEALQRTMMEK